MNGRIGDSVLNEQAIVQAFIASIKNYEKCSISERKKRGLTYKFKYVAWYILFLLFSPRKYEKGNIFAACMTPVNERKIHEYCPDSNLYRFAKLNAPLAAVKKNISVVCELNHLERFFLLCRSFGFYLRYKPKLKGYFHFTLEYYAIACFLEKKRFKQYITPGMYERYCTLFSYLGREFGAKLIGVQDGAAVSIDVPAKVFVDEMNAFDKYEASILSEFIKNKDCKYIYTGFKSVLQWDHYNKTNKKLLAIASQDWFTTKTIALVSEMMKSSLIDKWEVVLLPHYRESMDNYEELIRNNPELIVEPRKRYDNIDLLITFYSTIVYDFWSVNKKLEVFCLRIPGYTPSYYERENVKVFDNPKDLIMAIIECNI